MDKIPLVKGGQGRSAASVIDAAWAFGICLFVAGIVAWILVFASCSGSGGGGSSKAPPDNRTVFDLTNAGKWEIVAFERLPGGRGSQYTLPPSTVEFGEEGIDYLDGVPVTKDDFIREFHGGEGVISIWRVTFNPDDRNFPPDFKWTSIWVQWMWLKLACPSIPNGPGTIVEQKAHSLTIQLDPSPGATEDQLLVTWNIIHSLTGPNCVNKEWVDLEVEHTNATYEPVK